MPCAAGVGKLAASRTRATAVKNNAATDDCFVPELCQAEALLGLVLLAELLVLVLVLAEPMMAGFDWMRLALTSLFVQWIVLLAAGTVCLLRPALARLRPGLAGVVCCAVVVGLTLACTDTVGSSPLSATAIEDWATSTSNCAARTAGFS